MANQRISLKNRRALDAKGVDAIITPTENSPDSSRALEPEQTASPVAKMTVYVRPDQVLSIEEIQLAERKRTGKRRDKSELVQEAFDLLIEKYRDSA